jgi:membrane protease subunit HflK
VPDALRPGIDGYLVTADRNIVHCRAQLFYRVSDPVAFYEMQSDGEGVLRSLLHHACVRASSRRTIEEVLFELPAFSERASLYLTESASALGLGVTVNRLVLRVVPPRQVKDAFDAQIAAGQEADQARKEAESYRVSVLNDAAVLADRAVSDAEAQRRTDVQQAEARADTFRTLLTQYRAIGDAMMQDLHTSTLKRVLEAVDETFLVSEEQGRQVRLQLGRRVERKTGNDNDQEPRTRD